MSSKTSTKTRTVIRRVLEETGYAYMVTCESDHVNTDFADYASSHALESFQSALHDPNLSYEDLCKMLRRAGKRESMRRCKTPWSMFMANYLQNHSNSNKTGSVN